MTSSHKCKRGMIYRKSYTRKIGDTKHRISGRCIRSQTRSSPLKPTNKKRMRGFTMKRRALYTCPSGFIKRASFVRQTRSGKKTLVPEQCIRNIGAPGKGLRTGKPGIGTLRKGELAKYGYTHVTSMPIQERRSALSKAVTEYGSLGVWRKLNAVHVYTRRLSPAASKIFKADMDWIRATYGIKAF
jgi:hypothetical protein